jgi:hypothetical protein
MASEEKVLVKTVPLSRSEAGYELLMVEADNAVDARVGV